MTSMKVNMGVSRDMHEAIDMLSDAYLSYLLIPECCVRNGRERKKNRVWCKCVRLKIIKHAQRRKE